MRRVLLLLTVVALMVVMLAMTASSAMAFRFPPPPSPGEPLISYGKYAVIHCGPFSEPIPDFHGAVPTGNQGQGGNCVVAPPQ